MRPTSRRPPAISDSSEQSSVLIVIRVVPGPLLGIDVLVIPRGSVVRKATSLGERHLPVSGAGRLEGLIGLEGVPPSRGDHGAVVVLLAHRMGAEQIGFHWTAGVGVDDRHVVINRRSVVVATAGGQRSGSRPGQRSRNGIERSPRSMCQDTKAATSPDPSRILGHVTSRVAGQSPTSSACR